jgi:outer membrane receptor for ferrienterochelin and colicins
MKRGIQIALVATILWGLGTDTGLAEETGQLDGRLVNAEDRGLVGVTVVVGESHPAQLTDDEGRFGFDALPTGSYTLRFSLGENVHSEPVEIEVGQTTAVLSVADWQGSFADSIEVYSASLRRQRLVEAPAAVTVITAEQIAREGAHGQLPKLFEFTPGVELTQNGLYDFNLNSRGFNSSLNRRMLTLVDGRDVSLIFIGYQEWTTALSGSLDILESAELIRGPGSALYGANAYSGVLNLVTKAPSQSRGGRLRLTGGELDTARADLTYAGGFGKGYFARLNGGYLESDDFSRSRVDRNGDGVADVGAEVEYEGLRLEGIPLVSDRNRIWWASLRLDKELDQGKLLRLELGDASYRSGGSLLAGSGRQQTLDSARPFVQVGFNTPHWNFQSYHLTRTENDMRALNTNTRFYFDGDRWDTEVQGNTGFARDRGRLVGGASYRKETFTSRNPQGVQTLVFDDVDAEFESLFGQLEYDLSDKLSGVLSLRWDDSNLHSSQVSPRLALVYAPSPRHGFRVSYGQAFQRPNLPEYFLQITIGAPSSALAGLEETYCTPNGVYCGLDRIFPKALGNPDIEIEEAETFEVGYKGTLANRFFLTLDYYENHMENFITDLIPAVNPTLGILNPAFGPYRAPSGLAEPFASELEAAVGGAIPTVTNDPVTELAILKIITYTNFGEVDVRGFEMGLSARIDESWSFDMAYNWFDFEVREQIEQDPLRANAPENQLALGVSYQAERFSGSLRYRYVEAFDWAAGAFSGPVPSYDLLDLAAQYSFSDRIELTLNISNLADDLHYQAFGGDLLGRRGLVSLGLRW